jgi:hypothetical protein
MKLAPALVIIALIAPPAALAQFKALETKQLRLLTFGEAQSYLVPHTARCFELTMDRYRPLFDWTPSERVTMLLHDFKDRGNASAGAVPTNRVIIVISPFSYAFEMTLGNERIGMVNNHELIHVMASDVAAPADLRARAFFRGKVFPEASAPLSVLYGYLTNPRNYAPRWYHEGIATFMETWSGGGMGRTLGAYDEMVFRTLVHDNATIWDTVGLESEGVKTDFQVGMNSYLYGTRFYSYLGRTYGPEKVIDWAARRPGSKGYFASQFMHVFGAPLPKIWDEWIAAERTFQAENLATVRQHPVTTGKPVATRPLGSVSRGYFDPSTRELYLGVSYPGQMAHVAAINVDTGSIRKLTNIKGPMTIAVTSLAYDPQGKMLYYTTDNSDWRDLVAVDPATGRTKTLLKDERIGDLAYNPTDRSLWGVRHFNGISTLVRIPHPYREWNQVYSWPFGQDIYDIDLSPDGTTISAALTEVSGRQQLILLKVANLLKGDSSYEAVSDFSFSSPAGFNFSADGRYIYGSSYYSGVSNIYRYDVASKEIRPITNVETGVFRPIPIDDDTLIAFLFTSKGFEPQYVSAKPVDEIAAIKFAGQEIVDRFPIVKSWMGAAPSSLDLDSRITYDGPYNELGHIGLRNIYPIVEGYKDSVAGGVRMLFASPLDFHRIDVTASVSPDGSLESKERFHLLANYSYLDWKLTAKYNAGDFYDLFGPTKQSRKGYSLGGQFKKYLIYDEPGRFMDYSVNLTGYADLEKLPGAQNIDVVYDRMVSLSARWSYKFLEKSLGAIDDEKGYHLELVGGSDYAHSEYIPQVYGRALLGVPLPIGHSSLWFQGAAGRAWGDRSDPLSSYYFGAFGNNWVDYQGERRFRETQSFPGLEINQVGGRSFAKALVEWDPPALVFRSVGSPSFYLTWARLSLFGMGLVLNPGESTHRQTVKNVGAQVDLRFIALSHHNLTFSLGWARAFREHGRSVNETMVSLKIL